MSQVDSSPELEDLVAKIACALVDDPEQVRVNVIHGQQTAVIELKVAKADLGKIIGRKGRTATAMRTILAAASTKLRQRTVLEIIE